MEISDRRSTAEILKIEGFSPNCLMGTVGAVAKYKFDIPNIHKLYFGYSYVYEKPSGVIGFSSDTPFLDIKFTRDLPLEKDAFLRRLKRYYGITLLHKAYPGFEDVRADIEVITERGEPVITEIDFYYVRQHLYYHRFHDGHMMILLGVDRDPSLLSVVEAVFGSYDFRMDDYRDYCRDVLARERPFYLMTIKHEPAHATRIERDELLDDLHASLGNLKSEEERRGVRALECFIHDFERFYQENSAGERKPFHIPGFWAFMCNAMNNYRFLVELENDWPLGPQNLLKRLKSKMAWLNKRWFTLNLAMDRSMAEGDFSLTEKMRPVLLDILNTEEDTVKLVADLRAEAIGM